MGSNVAVPTESTSNETLVLMNNRSPNVTSKRLIFLTALIDYHKHNYEGLSSIVFNCIVLLYDQYCLFTCYMSLDISQTR